MNLRCIILNISVCTFLSPSLFSQVPTFDTAAFYRHLKSGNLLMEQVVFGQRLRASISANGERKDSVTLDIAAAYFKLKMTDSCRSNLKRISAESKFSGRKTELLFSSLVLVSDYAAAEKDLSNLPPGIFNNDARISLSILKRDKNITDTANKNISPIMLDLRSKYYEVPHPSPFLAGTFSALLPGAGKWYIGYKRQALTSFIANAMFAAQAAESYVKAGVSSPRFIITATLFGVFYTGNIWGSVLAAKKKKRDYLKELDHEILDYYHTEFAVLSR